MIPLIFVRIILLFNIIHAFTIDLKFPRDLMTYKVEVFCMENNIPRRIFQGVLIFDSRPYQGRRSIRYPLIRYPPFSLHFG